MKNSIGVASTAGIEYILDHLPYSEFNSILDIGCGDCFATYKFKENGKKVTALGLNIEEYGVKKNELREKNIEVIEDNFFTFDFQNKKYDAVWAAHILEHTTNPGLFLDRIKSLLNPDGYAIIVVPPYKSKLVGGHMCTGWTLGQLTYFLLTNGFDVKNGQFVKNGYNLVAIVRIADYELPKINHDKGDLEILADYFPSEMNIKQGSEGDIYSINWPYQITKEERNYRWMTFKSEILSFLERSKYSIKNICSDYKKN